jgi:hypothetical protein
MALVDNKNILWTDDVRRIVPATGNSHLISYVGFDFELCHVTLSDPISTPQYVPSYVAKRLESLEL